MKKNLLLLVLYGLILIACSADKKMPLSSYKNALISFNPETAQFYPDNTRLKKCVLSDTARLDTFKCIGTLQLFENGRIKQFETATPFQIDQYTVPPNSIIVFDEKKKSMIKYVCLARDYVLNNIECKGGPGSSVEFNLGKMTACYLAKDQEIDGFPCAANGKPVYFYSDGRVRIFSLSQDKVIGGKAFKKGETLLVDLAGQADRLGSKMAAKI